jgi:CBS domain-containing protein
MELIKNLIKVKGNEIWSIEPSASVFDAVKLMADKGIGALMVTQGNKLEGVISERDYARKVILKNRLSRETSVEEIMTTRVVYAHPEQNVEECMALMTEKHIRHLPIMVEEKLLAVVSIGDLVKSIIAQQQLTIKQLEQYVSGDW